MNQPNNSGIMMVILFCDWSVAVCDMENHMVTADRTGRIHGSGALRLVSQRKLVLAAPKLSTKALFCSTRKNTMSTGNGIYIGRHPDRGLTLLSRYSSAMRC